MPAPKPYKSALYQFMSFLDGTTYSPTDDTVNFSAERLASITADDIVHYFNFKAYGTPEPGANDFPKLCRSSTLFYQKKAISYFMPRQNMQWDDVAHQGNPTKSTAVNKVIVEIKKGSSETHLLSEECILGGGRTVNEERSHVESCD